MKRRVIKLLSGGAQVSSRAWCEGRAPHRGMNFDWNDSTSLIFTHNGWLPAGSAMSSPHQQLKDAKNEGERTHPVSLKVKSNLQIFPFCERVGGCWDMLWKKKKKIYIRFPLPNPARASPFCGSRSLNDGPPEKILFNQCLERTLVISADPVSPPTPTPTPHLPWHFLGNCFSHYLISDISSSHVRLAPRQRPQRSQSHLCRDAAPSKLGLLCACVWGERLTGEGEK